MPHVLFGLGGGLGAIARFALTRWITHRFPLSTLIANLLGCFLLGLGQAVLPILPGGEGEDTRLLVTGFCGGFTTFSSFAYQTLDLRRRFTLWHAAANILFSLLLCLGALVVGQAFGAQLLPSTASGAG
ncbi:fluoride efflux transporter FluC [Halochromatium sp.]